MLPSLPALTPYREPSTVITVAGSGFGATQSDSTLAIPAYPLWSAVGATANRRTVPEIA